MEVIDNYEYKGQIIELQSGDIVEIGEKTDSNGDYPDWVHCKSVKTGKSGWVAARILMIKDTAVVVNEDYTSEKMTVFAGDVVDTIFELNGWYWCKRILDSKEAWIDKKNLKYIAV